MIATNVELDDPFYVSECCVVINAIVVSLGLQGGKKRKKGKKSLRMGGIHPKKKKKKRKG